MRRLAPTLATATLVIGCAGAAAAAPWQSVNQRERLLDDRIDAGVHSGQLTAAEAARLRSDFRSVVFLENRYRAGGLSAWERADLDRRFDALTARIRYERRDDQVRPDRWRDAHGRWMSVNARQRELDHRIDMGVRSGRLTRAEALNLRRDYRRIARLENRYRRGGLSISERADLDRRFDGLAARISWQANDSQYSYGYRR